jgi:hypothetical protein
MSSMPNFEAFCQDACIKAWGQPDHKTKKELRWGTDSYNYRTYDIRKHVWYDAGAQCGGSTLELVAHVKGEPGKQLCGAAFFEAWQYAYDQKWVPDPPPSKPNGSGGKSIIARYAYHDEQGELLYEVVRFDTNDINERFRQRRPDAHGGWIWKVKGKRQVLYRLPELIAAVKAGQRVLVTEGEKDSNTAVRLGYPATTNPGGIRKWRKEFDELFRDADVVVVSDNDPQLKDKKTGVLQFHRDGRPILPGQDHAAAVARRLSRVAAHVCTIIFPQKDLTEWVESGGTREQLDALIAQAPEQKGQQREQSEEEQRGSESDAEQVLAELNRDNCVVLDGARTMVLRFEETEHDAGGERYVYRVPTFLRFYDLRNLYLNRRIMVGDDHLIDVGRWWLTHRDRRQYRGVTFKPAGKPIIDGRLNLWCGWGVEPKRGDWGLLREHIFEVLAARDEDVDAYTCNWMAWAVQHPGEQAEVALVFIGDRGTGKGTLGKALCKIFGQHSLHLSSPEHLTGRFNSHLRQCSFLFGDECYGPRDKAAEGTFKRIITEDTLTIEAKGRDPIEVPNRLHVMLASNNEWVIPAGAHERRFVVQTVADTHRQDAAWFGPIYKHMRSGGYEAMLFDLLHRDLGDWHPRQIVRTAALAEQQEESLSPLDAWWLELLQTAVLTGADPTSPDRAISNRYEDEVIESDGFGGQRKRTVRRDGLYDQARAISPKLKGTSDTALGRYLRDHGCNNAWVRRHRGWQFPPLAECRARWLERFPMTTWHDPQTLDWTCEGED